MGQKLMEIFDVVTKKVGVEGRMQLAERTGISKVKASKMEESRENISRLKEAASEIIGENVDNYLRRW